MKKNKFDKKIRFSYFLPYGFVSPLALRLSLPAPEILSTPFLPDKSSNEREAEAILFQTRSADTMKTMDKYGFTNTETVRFGGSTEQTLRLTRLTRTGLYTLTNTPSGPDGYDQPPLTRFKKDKNRNGEEYTYLPMDEASCYERNYLFDLAQKKETSQQAAETFETIFSESVLYSCGILASEPYKASLITKTTNIRDGYLYKAWRLSNIDSLMKGNGFLTSLDRRTLIPYLTYLRELEEYDETETEKKPTLKPYQEYDILPIEEREKKMQTDYYLFAKMTLNSWYRNHPECKLYLQPDREVDLEGLSRKVPEFYPIDEIPGFKSVSPECNEINVRGSLQKFRFYVSGVLIGTKQTYMVHHTKPGKTPWRPTAERRTLEKIQPVMESLAKLSGRSELDREVRNALIVCPSIQQFAALFRHSKAYIAKRWMRERRVGIPYEKVNIVPLNHSGLYQFRILAMSSPEEMEQVIMNGVLDREGNRTTDGLFQLRKNPFDPESEAYFRPIDDPVYTAAYEGGPVLVAYTMDFQRLYRAWEDYNEGKRFYCLCYPEQIKFIRKIMPEVIFL